MRHTIGAFLFFAALSAQAGAPAGAQVPRAPQARAFALAGPEDADRAMIGVSTSPGGVRDTLGLLVTAVEPGGPAEQAGVEEGNRLQAINGVNLRLSRDDAADEYARGINQNRLVRELRKVKPGDDVTLEVWASGRTRTVKVKTVAARALASRHDTEAWIERGPGTIRIERGPGEMRILRAPDDERDGRGRGDRAVLGVLLEATGTTRDTLGVFVQRVVAGGPAEQAGIVEGDRIASINGVDVRVAREDAGDPEAAAARIDRLQRELGKLKPGDAADLVVKAGGRSRTVQVTTRRAADVPGTGELAPPMDALHGQMRELPRAMDHLFERLRDLQLRVRTRFITRI